VYKANVALAGAFFFLMVLGLPVTAVLAEDVAIPEESLEESSSEATEPQVSAEPPAPAEEQPSELVAAEKPAEQPMQPRRHLVQPGDTLWSISMTYLIDPFYWPKVWDANRAIKNPDLIYPGNVITLPSSEDLKAAIPKEMEAPPEPMPVEEEMVEEEPVTEAPKEAMPMPSAPPITVEEPAQRPLDIALLASVGYVLRGGIGDSGVLVGVKDHKVLIGEGDVVYLKPGKFNSKEGDTLIIYRKIRNVYHPKTGKYLGKLVAVLGTMKVTEVGRKVTTAKILKSYHYMLAGDLVAPYGSIPLPSLEEVPSGKRAQVDGYVVDIKEDKVTIAQFDVVYIDRGIKDGIGRGSSFKVIRDGERTPYFSAGGRVLLPSRIVGELEVITVNDHTATAKVRRSSEPINRGDRIQALPVQ
jgi:LysM repeat protein